MSTLSSSKKRILNVAFILVSAGILFILFEAPKETTVPLPYDEIHKRFYAIKEKKEAEQFCLDCHGPGKDVPFPVDHPPKYRCLFCHKRR